MSAKNIKIAYFIDRLIRGGSELQLIGQINRFHLEGIQQELFCLYKTGEHDKLDINCKVIFLNITKLISPNCLKKLYWLVIYLRDRNFNIVQTYFFDSTMIGVFAAKIAGRIKIISCRRDLGFWYTPTLIFFLRILNRMTHRILLNSNAVKQSVLEKEGADPNHIDIIPNGIDISQFNYPKEEKEKRRWQLSIKSHEVCVGMITNMSRKVKRVDIFIKAASYALGKRKDLKFIILGDGKLKGELITIARDLGIDNNIAFLGRDISKHKALPAMDIGVLSSDSEGLPNAIMEYMAAGLPVVATAVGGNIDLVKNESTGFLTIPGDFRDLGEKILKLANDGKKRLAYGENGRRSIIDYNWDKIVDMLVKYYHDQIRL